ncbi:MAG TPA: hypothetical protein DCS93_26225 [Microscillaceae bacterium]|nr:hypothetical protein [Microscillaceae bacterium]
MKKLSEIEAWNETEALVDDPGMDDCIAALVYQENVLITMHFQEVRIWSIEDLPQVKLISVLKLPTSSSNIKLQHNSLYVYASPLLVIDLSEITQPVISFEQKIENLGTGYRDDDLFYFAIENDLVSLDANGKFETLASVESYDQFFKSYPKDVSKVDQTLVVVGRHLGVHIYTQTDSLTWKLQSTHKVGYPPTTIHWEKPGERMLLIGNSEVIRYDITNRKKPKRHKACKLNKTELCGHYTQKDNEILVAGNKGAKDKFAAGVIELTQNEIRLVQQPKLTYKVKTNRDTIKTLCVKDDFLLIVGRESGCFLFKAGE